MPTNSKHSNKLTFHNKEKFCKELTINDSFLIPQTYYYDEKISENGKYILKPVFSNKNKNKTIFLKNDEEYIVSSGCILQKFIDSKKELSFLALCYEGKMIHYVLYECDDFYDGFSTMRKLCTDQNILKNVHQIIDLTKVIVDENYSGFVGIDILLGLDNKFYFLELNPRVTNGIVFFKDNPPREIITLAPYLSKEMKLDRIKKALQTTNDIYDNNDIFPFVYSILLLFWNVLISVFLLTNPKIYIDQKIKKSIVTFNMPRT